MWLKATALLAMHDEDGGADAACAVCDGGLTGSQIDRMTKRDLSDLAETYIHTT